MGSIKVFDQNKVEKKDLDVNDAFFKAEINPSILKDSVLSNLAEKRQGTHKTKGRSEVSGSRKKLFRQKGTGNARAGYLQSPIRRGGGTVFGPGYTNYTISINKKVKKKNLISIIADKIKSNSLTIVSELTLESSKTKDFKRILNGLGFSKALVVVNNVDEKIVLSSRNLKEYKIVNQKNLNSFDLLLFEKVVFIEEAFVELEGRLVG